MSNRTLILATVYDLVSDLLYYDRKEDEELRLGDIQDAIDNGYITEEEIVAVFSGALSNMLKE